MGLHDRSYRRWKGERRPPIDVVPVIAVAGIEAASRNFFRRKIPAVILTLGAFALFLFGLVVIFLRYYVLTNAEALHPEVVEFVANEELVEMTTASGFTVLIYMTGPQSIFAALACILMGSGLVANDRRTNALEIYLARPVTVSQYLLGKLGTIAFFVAVVTVIPATILVLAQLLVSFGDPDEVRRLVNVLWRTMAAGGVIVIVPSLLILTASSLATKARNAAILWIALIFIMDVIGANAMREIFGNDDLFLCSFAFNILQTTAWILQVDAEIAATVPVWKSAVVLLGWSLLCIHTVMRRTKPVEIVA